MARQGTSSNPDIAPGPGHGKYKDELAPAVVGGRPTVVSKTHLPVIPTWHQFFSLTTSYIVHAFLFSLLLPRFAPSPLFPTSFANAFVDQQVLPVLEPPDLPRASTTAEETC